MKTIEIVAIIAVALIGLGIFVVLITESVISYRRSKKMKLVDYLDNYYAFYHPAIRGNMDKSGMFADDIYFVMDKHFSYDDCEKLAELLTVIGYCKKED